MITKPKPESWVTFPKPNPQANLRLFCFPYAGGNAMSFRRWENSLPNTIEVCPLELPGRGTRIMEEPLTDFSQLIFAITEAIVSYLDKPFAFFGHSMGSIVSFEVARLLQKYYVLSPVHLFISGRGAPQIPLEIKPIHTLPQHEFIEELRRMNGTPQEVLDNAELMELLLPMLRADFKLIENYTYTSAQPIPCPITAFGGKQDYKVSCDRLQAWQEQTTAKFAMQMFPGDHFFLHSAQKLLLQTLAQKLYQLTYKIINYQQCA